MNRMIEKRMKTRISKIKTGTFAPVFIFYTGLIPFPSIQNIQ
jgi:hypothetical protein